MNNSYNFFHQEATQLKQDKLHQVQYKKHATETASTAKLRQKIVQ